jgi:hypothetical protein
MSQSVITETVNRHVACRPFKAAADGTERRKGELAIITSSMKLEELEVVLDFTYGDSCVMWSLHTGDRVYVKADQYVQQWAKTKYTMPNVNGGFILVPWEYIFATKTTMEKTE